ncbi:MAG: hypothetical protein RBU37_28025, partial [Myxococcota bacterium]|nr:hypothetical protein [Myxococcota bacterium]
AKSIQDKYGDGFVAIVEERWHWSYYPVAQAFWELLNRHWDTDFERKTDELGNIVTEEPLYEARLKNSLKNKVKKEEHRSWVENNLRMLHEGINTKLTGEP